MSPICPCSFFEAQKHILLTLLSLEVCLIGLSVLRMSKSDVAHRLISVELLVTRLEMNVEHPGIVVVIHLPWHRDIYSTHHVHQLLHLVEADDNHFVYGNAN